MMPWLFRKINVCKTVLETKCARATSLFSLTVKTNAKNVFILTKLALLKWLKKIAASVLESAPALTD